MTKFITETRGSGPLLAALLRVQIDQRYHGSVLGLLWALLFPMLTILSFSIIFAGLSGSNLADYGIYFFCGYVPWALFQSTCLQSAESLVGNSFYVTRIAIPKQVLPVVTVAANGIDFAASMLVLLALMPLLGAPFHPAMLCLPLSILITFAAITGAAMICAQATVFFRDFRYLLNSALFLWFFFSPVLWKPESLGSPIRDLYRLNPVVPFLELFQLPIWKGVMPAGEVWALASLWAAGLLIAGTATFARNQKRFYYYL